MDSTVTENRAWISGLAGRAFVADGEVLFTLSASAGETPELATPARLANFLRFYGDVEETSADEYPYEAVFWDLDRRTSATRCVEFLLAALDREIDWNARVTALKAADRLLGSEENLEFASLLFLNTIPPQEAHLAGARAIAMAEGYKMAAAFLQRVNQAVPEIQAFRKAWDAFVLGLPEPSLRAAAEDFADGARFIARAVRSESSAALGGDLLSALTVLDGTPLQEHVKKWILDANRLKRKFMPLRIRWRPRSSYKARRAETKTKTPDRHLTRSDYEAIYLKERFLYGSGLDRAMEQTGKTIVRGPASAIRKLTIAELLKRMKNWE